MLREIQPPIFGLDYRRNAETAGVWPHGEEFFQHHFVREEALRFLGRPSDRPFFAYLSFDFPHPPFLVPEKWWDFFDPDELTLPPRDPNRPIHPNWGGELVNETMIRNYLRGYHAALAAVDEAGWKNRAICENYWPARTERDGTVRGEDYGRMIRRGQYKCCVGGNMPEPCSLFDLEEDPDEFENRWDDPGLRDICNNLVEELEVDWRKIPEPARASARCGDRSSQS